MNKLSFSLSFRISLITIEKVEWTKYSKPSYVVNKINKSSHIPTATFEIFTPYKWQWKCKQSGHCPGVLLLICFQNFKPQFFIGTQLQNNGDHGFHWFLKRNANNRKYWKVSQVWELEWKACSETEHRIWLRIICRDTLGHQLHLCFHYELLFLS